MTALSTTPRLQESRLACSYEFLAGSAERSSWTQFGGHRAAGITEPRKRNETPAGDEDGRDRVRHAEGMH